MKIKLLAIIMTTLTFGTFAQTNVLKILNGDFELGTTQLWHAVEVRAGTLWWLGVDNALSSVVVSENSHSGNYAAAFTWEIDAAMADLLFDLSPMILPATNYTFKAWAKSLDGPCILRIHCTYYTASNTVVGDYNDQSWVLSDVYEEHVWEVPTAPEGVLFGQIGFRVFQENGSRWPATAVTTLIDDVTMTRDKLESDGVEFKLSTEFMGAGTGTVQLEPAGGMYCAGAQVSATFIPDAGSQFVSWSGDVSGNEETVTIIMDGEKTIVAESDITNGVEDMDRQPSNLICYPNPFNSSTTLSYSLSTNSKVRISIYNVTGSLVNILVNRNQNKGEHKVVWNGTSLTGANLSDGIYFGRLDTSNGKSQNIKILLNN